MTIAEFFQEYWTYLTIPLVSAIVGYGTNWLAVKMMMGPVEFQGVGPIGWQGVIPANSEKMARVVVDHSVRRVLTQEELISRVHPEHLVDAMSNRLENFVEELVDEVMEQTTSYGFKVSNFLWSASPIWLKEKVYDEVKKQLPDMVRKMVDDIKDESEDLLDLNELIVEKLGNNKEMLIDIFKTSGAKEFRFLERSGFYFGFPLGIPVMFLWYFYPVWWLLPLFGLLVGYLTNTIAIYLIQKPVEPVKVGPFTILGLFIKRQKEVSRYFGKVFAEDLIRAEIVAEEFLKSKNSVDRIRDMIHREVNHSLEATQGSFKPLTVMSIGPTQYARISDIISDRTIKELERPDKRSLNYIDKAFDIEETVAERVGNLPGEEFYELLHPVVAEDEWKLIAVGAVLGLLAGFWQWALLT
ncbi:MAG: DUF445 family protein [Candidatus Pelagadaptatus aseana]|uniref:DUF445 domain-containing protein n=1 Tax=Candidatus Pelagadaptatus aseana TaxID=3120508 RepID=UPI0039B17B09